MTPTSESGHKLGVIMDEPLRDTKERVLVEGLKTYIIINAVGAAILLAFLQAIWSATGAVPLKTGVLWGIVAFAAGVAVATLGYLARHSALRRSQVNSGFFFQLASVWIPLIAIACFLAGTALPVRGGFNALASQSASLAKSNPDAGRRR